MTLEEFVSDWLERSPIHPPPNAYDQVAGNVGVTLYRDEIFQVQLWTFPPRAVVTDHAHPNVDTWLVKVTGRFSMKLNGVGLEPRDAIRTAWRGMKTWMTRVAPGDIHGVKVGPSGGSFLSITERLDGAMPESVHLSWKGAPLDDEHAAILKQKAR